MDGIGKCCGSARIGGHRVGRVGCGLTATFHPPAAGSAAAVILLPDKVGNTSSNPIMPRGGCNGPATCNAFGAPPRGMFNRSTTIGVPVESCRPIGPRGRAILRIAGDNAPDGTRLVATCPLIVALTPLRLI